MMGSQSEKQQIIVVRIPCLFWSAADSHQAIDKLITESGWGQGSRDSGKLGETQVGQCGLEDSEDNVDQEEITYFRPHWESGDS